MSDLEFFYSFSIFQLFFNASFMYVFQYMYITLQLYFAWSHFALLLLRFHCLTFIFFSLLLLFFVASWSVLEASLNDYMCVHAHEDFFVLLIPLTFPSCAVLFSHLILEVLVGRGFTWNASLSYWTRFLNIVLKLWGFLFIYSNFEYFL